MAWAAPLAALLIAAVPAFAQAPGYQIIGNDPGALEIRFHGVGLRGVHADDRQNALSLDFLEPVDGALFDHLTGQAPQWISMAYANFDNGIIRSPKPVTFLTRSESDGFSLRIVPRGPARAESAPPPLRGAYPEYPPPPQAAYGGSHAHAGSDPATGGRVARLGPNV